MGWFGSTLLRSGTFSAYNGFSMIQANGRARFTAADFDFVVRTLARSQSESVSLVDLLADSETRDSVIDSPRLMEAILCNDSQLRISSQFYFYVLARYVLRDAGIRDRKLCDYVGSLLENFSRAHLLRGPQAEADESPRQYLSDMLIALSRATQDEAFLLRAHVGNYSLFISGIFHESAQRRHGRGGPDLAFYEQIGSRNYGLVANDATAKRCELDDVYEELADRFHEVRLALNHLAEELINLDDDSNAGLVF